RAIRHLFAPLEEHGTGPTELFNDTAFASQADNTSHPSLRGLVPWLFRSNLDQSVEATGLPQPGRFIVQYHARRQTTLTAHDRLVRPPSLIPGAIHQRLLLTTVYFNHRARDVMH